MPLWMKIISGAVHGTRCKKSKTKPAFTSGDAHPKTFYKSELSSGHEVTNYLINVTFPLKVFLILLSNSASMIYT